MPFGNAAQTRGLGTDEAIALLWTVPWNGQESMPLSRLHPLFVEICRRIRLECREEKLVAKRANSEHSRVDAEHLHGDLADPWTPVERSDSPKALSITSEGFSYRRMTELLFGSSKRSWWLPLLARSRGREGASALQIVGAGIARGQGKTEGFHRRVVDIPAKAVSLMESGDESTGARAQERVRRAGEVQGKCLRAALIVLVQKGPAEPSPGRGDDGMTGSDDEPLWRTEARWLAAIAARLAEPGFPTGDHAALRRMAPHAPSGHAEIAAERLFGAANADPEGEDRRRWLLIVHCLALARGRHAPDTRAGRLLADMHYSEERLSRLLSSDFEVVADVLPQLARWLDSKGAAIDWLPLVRLARWTGRIEDRADRARHGIARDYARAAVGH